MKCLIVAAGQGVRLRAKGALKPLIPLRGVPLIESVMTRTMQAGVDEFFVVSGYRGDELRAFLNRYAARETVRITHVINRQWDRANGYSVTMARQFLDEPFLLVMCDHLVDPALIRALIAHGTPEDTVTLAVDYNLDSPLNDPDDVTRVQVEDGRIIHIGKVIRTYNAYDTGVFLCTPVMFAALEESQAAGDDSISGAMNVLAGWGRAHVFDIGDRVWVDVDDPLAFGKAEQLLAEGRL
ncbi:phosphocholine cytidylyltransferase family protein [Granulibacter bethesdensis]|uniref:phosphocholine cytidylyltransferase family protein n=1 Tax=Granulibacter bethesdensis TaxID=364410 RepID=UPI0003F1EE17|nr:NTP transferase domain-containing protein [Granulibacter bethesdensis]AHJ64611.1 Nucleotidyltransferase family protein [Granulibacter bethesdensis CGDNIH4]